MKIEFANSIIYRWSKVTRVLMIVASYGSANELAG